MGKYSNTFYAATMAILATMGIAWWQGIGSFMFAWVFHFMLMTVVLAASDAAMPRHSSSYFSLQPWEKDGMIYKWLGVNLYRKILVWVGWEKLNKKNNTVKKTATSLQHLEYLTRQSEFGHALIFVIVCILSVCLVILYDFETTYWLLLLNIPFHIYPVILQRYNRPRFQRAMNRLQAEKTSS